MYLFVFNDAWRDSIKEFLLVSERSGGEGGKNGGPGVAGTKEKDKKTE